MIIAAREHLFIWVPPGPRSQVLTFHSLQAKVAGSVTSLLGGSLMLWSGRESGGLGSGLGSAIHKLGDPGQAVLPNSGLGFLTYKLGPPSFQCNSF